MQRHSRIPISVPLPLREREVLDPEAAAPSRQGRCGSRLAVELMGLLAPSFARPCAEVPEAGVVAGRRTRRGRRDAQDGIAEGPGSPASSEGRSKGSRFEGLRDLFPRLALQVPLLQRVWFAFRLPAGLWLGLTARNDMHGLLVELPYSRRNRNVHGAISGAALVAGAELAACISVAAQDVRHRRAVCSSLDVRMLRPCKTAVVYRLVSAREEASAARGQVACSQRVTIDAFDSRDPRVAKRVARCRALIVSAPMEPFRQDVARPETD